MPHIRHRYNAERHRPHLCVSEHHRQDRNPEENIPGIYEGGRPYIASFARTVFQARKDGDEIAEQIFQKAVNAMAELTYAADKYFDETYDVVLGGGIFASFPEC